MLLKDVFVFFTYLFSLYLWFFLLILSVSPDFFSYFSLSSFCLFFLFFSFSFLLFCAQFPRKPSQVKFKVKPKRRKTVQIDEYVPVKVKTQHSHMSKSWYKISYLRNRRECPFVLNIFDTVSSMFLCLIEIIL